MLSDFDIATEKIIEDGEECYVVKFLDKQYENVSAIGKTIEETFAEAEIVAEMLLDMEMINIILQQPCVLEDDVVAKKYIIDTRGYIYDIVKWNIDALSRAPKRDLLYITKKLFEYYKDREIKIKEKTFDITANDDCGGCKHRLSFGNDEFFYCHNGDRCKRIAKDLYEV